MTCLWHCAISQYNVDAARASEKAELLKAGPWCFGDDTGTTALECDGRAQRTQRAGVWEMRVRSNVGLNHTTLAFTHPSFHSVSVGSGGYATIDITANPSSSGVE